MKVKINREDGAFEYAQAVLNGDINACVSVKKNCETFVDLWRAVESGVITDIRYNNSTLDKFYLVSKGLRHFEGQTRYLGKSIEWEPWQRYFFGNVYGWEVFDKELQEWVWLHKEIFLFCSYGELPFEKIALLFGKSPGWARVIYYRAKTKIKEYMEVLGNE